MIDNPEQTHLTKQARYRGQRAYLARRTFQQNPYPLDSGEGRAWSRGWNEKEKEMTV